ncbi:MAG: MATE family efflux transporter [Candidatus Ventricola sp.]
MFTKDKSFYRTFLRLTLALMVQQAVVLSVNLADNVMLGSYSETALSGVAAVNQIQFILQQLVFGFSNGMIVLASRYWGKQQIAPIRRLTAIAFWGALAVAAVLLALVSAWPRFIVGLFTADPAIIEQGCAYLSIVRYSYVFFAATTVLLGGLRAVERVRIALNVSVMALLVNCSINFVLIQGRFGLPELGARGAAIGTLTADQRLRLRPRDLLRLERTLLGDFARVSIPVIVTNALWGLNTAMQTVILGHMSSSAIAAHAISSTIFLFLKVTSVGAASASSVIIGKAVGEGDMDKIRAYTRTLQAIYGCIGLSLCGILLLLRTPLLRLYTLEPETLRLARQFILVEALVLVETSYQMCVNTGIIAGGGNPRFVLIVDLFVIWGFAIPLSLLCAFRWNAAPVVVMLALNADQTLKCFTAGIYCNSFRWIRSLTRPQEGQT